MATISVCMIVKNEEAVLARCLDSLAGIADELILVDTGSTDRTKEIAHRYTERVYEFAWINDFSAARNFAFSKATMEYIYSADADEVLDETNRARFLQLKEVILPEIEIVQMIYVNPEDCNMVYNYSRELRPKLFRRLRSFRWIDPIHETVALDPVVYDSDIEILHLPQSLHSKRDFLALFEAWKRQGGLSERLYGMYAKELFISGTTEDFLQAEPVFRERLEKESGAQGRMEAVCVLARQAFLCGDGERLLRLALSELTSDRPVAAELYYLLGEYAEERQELWEACGWYRKAAEHENYISIFHGGTQAIKKCVALCTTLGKIEEAKQFERYLHPREAGEDRGKDEGSNQTALRPEH